MNCTLFLVPRTQTNMTLGGKRRQHASKSDGDIQLIVRVFTTARHVWHDTALTCPTAQQRPNDTPDRAQPTCIHHYTDDNGSYLECGTKKITESTHKHIIYILYLYISFIFRNKCWLVRERAVEGVLTVHSFKIRKEKEKQCTVLVYCDRDLWGTQKQSAAARFWNKCGRNDSLFYISSTFYIGEVRIDL